MSESINLLPPVEQYAHSLSTIRRLGNIASHAALSGEQIEPIEELARADFSTAVTEMLKTDPEFRHQLDIENVHTHLIIDGKVRSPSGEPMIEIVETGYKKSLQMARFRPELEAQATRDFYDLENARRVDQLQPGQTLVTLSMDPKDELKKHKETYAKLGYKAGLSYLQFYSRTSTDTLVAGSFSVDLSDENTWRELFAAQGVLVPEGESPNAWINYGFVIQATPENAKEYVKSMRENYYKRAGSAAPRRSVTAFVSENRHIIDQFFDSYYPAIAKAINTGTNNESLNNLARSILDAGASNLAPEVLSRLVSIGNSAKFDDEDGKLIDSVVRYAAVEELRKGLSGSVPALMQNSRVMATVMQGNIGYMMNNINQVLAINVATGTTAGRSYGGCAGQIKLSSPDNDPLSSAGGGSGPQDAFGGGEDISEESRNNWKWKIGVCRVNTCPTRPSKTEVGPCDVCRKCQAKFDNGQDPTNTILPPADKKERPAKLFEFIKKSLPTSNEQLVKVA